MPGVFDPSVLVDPQCGTRYPKDHGRSMSRRATGTVEYRPGKDGAAGAWWGRVTSVDKSRPWIELGDWPNSQEGRARAKETAASWSERVRERGVGVVPQARRAARKVATSGGETFGAYAERWLNDREARGVASVRSDRSRMKTHVTPEWRSRPMTSIQPRDVEALVERLDGKVRGRMLSWKTALNTWVLVTKLFDDACSSKVLSLRVLAVNPAVEVRGPDRGAFKAKTYLWPSEFMQFVECDEVPLWWRRTVALSVYLFTRAGELEALQWDDVDLEHAIAHIHQAVDRTKGGVKLTKTGVARRLPIEPNLLPLLRVMRAERGTRARVVSIGVEQNLARDLREQLRVARLERADLFASDAARKPLGFHDLRATGLTWMAVRGDDPLKIQQRAGHGDFRTTQGYIREAEAVRDGFGDVFPPLPASLLESRDDSKSSENRPQTTQVFEIRVPKVGIEPTHPLRDCGF
jgi:integrase